MNQSLKFSDSCRKFYWGLFDKTDAQEVLKISFNTLHNCTFVLIHFISFSLEILKGILLFTNT